MRHSCKVSTHICFAVCAFCKLQVQHSRESLLTEV